MIFYWLCFLAYGIVWFYNLSSKDFYFLLLWDWFWLSIMFTNDLVFCWEGTKNVLLNMDVTLWDWFFVVLLYVGLEFVCFLDVRDDLFIGEDRNVLLINSNRKILDVEEFFGIHKAVGRWKITGNVTGQCYLS